MFPFWFKELTNDEIERAQDRIEDLTRGDSRSAWSYDPTDRGRFMERYLDSAIDVVGPDGSIERCASGMIRAIDDLREYDDGYWGGTSHKSVDPRRYEV